MPYGRGGSSPLQGIKQGNAGSTTSGVLHCVVQNPAALLWDLSEGEQAGYELRGFLGDPVGRLLGGDETRILAQHAL